MTQIGSVYGEALYELAQSENLSDEIKSQMQVLNESFSEEPDFLRLLCSPNLSKPERCQIIDQSFRGHVHIYLLNFLKILTEKGYIKQFPDCCEMFIQLYNRDHNIVSVTAVTAVALSPAQSQALTQKLTRITGKNILLRNRVTPACLGGVRLDYDGQRLDGTVKNRLDRLGDLLNNTVL